METIKAKNLPENPRERANPISALMFCYALPILFKGRKKTLQPTDLYKPLKSHKAATLGDKVSKAWDDEVAKSHLLNKEPSLVKVILRVFGWQLFVSGLILAFIEICLRATQPFLLVGLISEFIKGNGDGPDAQLYAAGMIINIVGTVTLTHPLMMGMMHMAMKMRVAMSCTIYRKALRLSKTALKDTTAGQIVNLTSNDLARFDRALIHLHFIWLAPAQLIFATYFLYVQIGVSTFFGIGILLSVLPLQTYLSRLVSRQRLRTALRTDQRVRMMNEIISGIQVIKMYAWEKPFGKLVQKIRVTEMESIRKANYIRGILLSFEVTLSRIAIFASLVGFVLLGHTLTAENAFFVTAFFNILRRSVTKFFPQGMSQYAELMVSLKRIKTFLMREETTVPDKSVEPEEDEDEADKAAREHGALIHSPNGLKKLPAKQRIQSVDGFIEIDGFTAKWDKDSIENTLDDINLKLKAPQLVAIIGPVGSGKSSLIQAILGELSPQLGSLEVNGTFSYASQEPWLFTGSVRENILFGLPMDHHRYRAVIRKCALVRDFDLLPYGDETIVGERGASLSGGQKARISLARAVYRKADIYLLDDPLSAVDTHVGRHLFDQCMMDFLRRKLVILATHQLQFLEEADLIVIMDKGKISAMGTYNEMLNSHEGFAQELVNSKDLHDHDEEGDLEDGVDTGKDKGRDKTTQTKFSTQRLDSTASSEYSTESLSDNKERETKGKPVQVQESRADGKIGFSLYKKYFGAGSGILMFLFIVLLCLGTQIAASGGDFFVSFWVRNEKHDDQTSDISYFTIITISIVIFALLRTILFFNMARQSSTNLHNGMFEGVSHAPMYFFNVNPSGRILNRFSMDLGQLDEVLPLVMLDVIQIFLTLAGIIIVLCITNPWYLTTTFALLISFYIWRQFYLKSSRDIKRLESIARSPMYSHLGASLNGLSTIRALGAQKMLTAQYDNFQDLHSSGYYTFLSTSRAFGYYLDFVCVIYIVIVIIDSIVNLPASAGLVGLIITQATGMTGSVQWGMRQSAELENSMTAVERVVEYKELEPEGEFESKPNKKPPESWPEEGKIVANHLSMRYFPDPRSATVLQEVSFIIKPREKIGIVGRTGAGKSSLINAIFRLSYNDGVMLIDERDISEIGLFDLRSKISIIPQEPVLFSGTMRYNLDPFEQYSDAKLWKSLEEVSLKQVITEMPTGLQSHISEGGSNFSVGQRQLVCLARAILRENRILVMDEATANVDPQTDALIQSTIRQKFKDCTVLTIAHRLHTIMDSDKVMVIDAGQVVEFGTPYELLTQSEIKVFHSMVMETGSFEHLMKIAQKAHQQGQNQNETPF